jgi:hypothetical protein
MSIELGATARRQVPLSLIEKGATGASAFGLAVNEGVRRVGLAGQMRCDRFSVRFRSQAVFFLDWAPD